MDKLDGDTSYDYVLFEVEPFANIQCLIVDLIQDKGAKAFMFTPKDKELEPCGDTISAEAVAQEIKEKLSK
jgi:hypothetical protein